MARRWSATSCSTPGTASGCGRLELGPFDYENEVYTRNLWVVEGLTSYYGDLLVHRAGFSTRKEFLKNLSKAIETLQTTPGRLVQPLDEASFDAWIKFYRRDENTPNSAVSYYTKGEVVAFLLDARIRRATGGKRSLDDALRLAYQRFSGERGYQPEEFRRVLEEVAGIDFSDIGGWLTRAVESTENLDYQEALDWYGLRFTSSDPEKKEDEKKEGGDPQELPAGWLGAEVQVQDGRLMVTQVKRDTPAYEAGLNVEDEILAIDDYRVPPDGIEGRLKFYRPGREGDPAGGPARPPDTPARHLRREAQAPLEARGAPRRHRGAEGPPRGVAGGRGVSCGEGRGEDAGDGCGALAPTRA